MAIQPGISTGQLLDWRHGIGEAWQQDRRLRLRMGAFLAADCKRRSSRSAFWWVWLADVSLLVILLVLGLANDLLMQLDTLYALAQIFPSLSVTVRRLRHAGKVWTWSFTSLVRFIGGIWLIVVLAQPSVSLPL